MFSWPKFLTMTCVLSEVTFKPHAGIGGGTVVTVRIPRASLAEVPSVRVS